MKKSILFLLLFLPFISNAQIIYQEDFESVIVPPNPGYAQLPAGLIF